MPYTFSEKSAFRQCWTNPEANTSLLYSWHTTAMVEKNLRSFQSKLTLGLYLLTGIEFILKDLQVTQYGTE